MEKISKSFFLGSIVVSFGCATLLNILGIVLGKIGNPNLGLGLSLLSWPFLIYGAMVNIVLWYKMWAAIQDGNARTTPGKAIGFMFIPIFNLYWVFPVIWGFAKDFNKYIERRRVSTKRLPEGLFLTFTILTVSVIATQKIPILGLFLAAVNYFICLVMVSKICDGINAIAVGSCYEIQELDQPMESPEERHERILTEKGFKEKFINRKA